ncbi:MAG TPA: hypothetical protein VGL56_06065 [Fimbriimonadaceae bacterium]|jgi:hypothetical protein
MKFTFAIAFAFLLIALMGCGDNSATPAEATKSAPPSAGSGGHKGGAGAAIPNFKENPNFKPGSMLGPHVKPGEAARLKAEAAKKEAEQKAAKPAP